MAPRSVKEEEFTVTVNNKRMKTTVTGGVVNPRFLDARFLKRRKMRDTSSFSVKVAHDYTAPTARHECKNKEPDSE
eukprot:4021336-Amphidinium_carterae.2